MGFVTELIDIEGARKNRERLDLSRNVLVELTPDPSPPRSSYLRRKIPHGVYQAKKHYAKVVNKVEEVIKLKKQGIPTYKIASKLCMGKGSVLAILRETKEGV